jgi:ribosome-associated protein
LDGVIILFAQGFRSQEMNRQDAVERLLALIRQAAHRRQGAHGHQAHLRL